MVRTEERGALAWIVLDRPARRNALDREALSAFTEAANDLAASDAVAAIGVRGEGGHFSAGADIDELASLRSPAEARDHARRGQAACNALEHAPVPVLAAIDGWCVGGGLELAMSCDLRVASRDARCGQVELGIGSIAAWGGLRRLPRLVGVAAAKQLLFTADAVGAEAAQRLGLVQEVVVNPAERVAEIADRLSAAPRQALAASKRALDQWVDVPLQAGLEQDRETFAQLLLGAELQEGVRAFLARSGRDGRPRRSASD